MRKAYGVLEVESLEDAVLLCNRVSLKFPIVTIDGPPGKRYVRGISKSIFETPTPSFNTRTYRYTSLLGWYPVPEFPTYAYNNPASL